MALCFALRPNLNKLFLILKGSRVTGTSKRETGTKLDV